MTSIFGYISTQCANASPTQIPARESNERHISIIQVNNPSNQAIDFRMQSPRSGRTVLQRAINAWQYSRIIYIAKPRESGLHLTFKNKDGAQALAHLNTTRLDKRKVTYTILPRQDGALTCTSRIES